MDAFIETSPARFWKREPQRTFYRVALLGTIFGAVAPAVLGADTGWLHSGAGSRNYQAGVHWVDGVINDTFDRSLTVTGQQELLFFSDHTTAGDLQFRYTAGFPSPSSADFVLQASGQSSALTLGGNLIFDPSEAGRALHIGTTFSTSSTLTLDLGGANRTFQIASGRVAINQAVANGEITKTGQGILRIGGRNSPGTFSGVNLKEGVLEIGTSPLDAPGTWPITLNGANVALQSSAGAYGLSAAGNSLIVNSDFKAQGANGLEFSGPVTLSGGIREINVAITDDIGFRLSGVISGATGSALRKSGEGSLYLRSANTFDGGTFLAGGTVWLGDPKAFGTGTITVEKRTAIGNNAFGGMSGSAAVSNAFQLASELILICGFTAFELSGPIQLTGSAPQITSRYSSGTGLKISGVISGGLENELNLGGNTFLELTGTNTYSGGTRISGGTIGIGNGAAFGSGPITIAGAATLRPTQNLTGSNAISNPLTVASDLLISTFNVSPLEFSGPVAINAPQVEIKLGDSTRSLIFSGPLNVPAGSKLKFAIAAQGEVVLKQAGAFSGEITLDSGAIALGHSTALGSGTFKLDVNYGALPTMRALIPLVGGSAVANNVSFGAAGIAGDQPFELSGVIELPPLSQTQITVTNTSDVTILSGTITAPPEMSAFRKWGRNKLIISGAGTYAGSTEIWEGELCLTGSLAGSVTVTSFFDPVLSGTGAIAGDLTTRGEVSPGGAGGDLCTLSIGGNYTQTSSGLLGIELGSFGTSDKLSIQNHALFGGTLSLLLMEGYSPKLGDLFQIFDFRTSAGAFENISAPSLAPGLSFDYSSLYTTGSISVVPEPSVLAIGACCGLIWSLTARPRRRTN